MLSTNIIIRFTCFNIYPHFSFPRLANDKVQLQNALMPSVCFWLGAKYNMNSIVMYINERKRTHPKLVAHHFEMFIRDSHAQAIENGVLCVRPAFYMSWFVFVQIVGNFCSAINSPIA